MKESSPVATVISNRKRDGDGEKEGAGNVPVARVSSDGGDARRRESGGGKYTVAGVASNGRVTCDGANGERAVHM